MLLYKEMEKVGVGDVKIVAHNHIEARLSLIWCPSP